MSLIILIIVNILIILFIMVHNFDFLAKVLSKCHSPWNIAGNVEAYHGCYATWMWNFQERSSWRCLFNHIPVTFSCLHDIHTCVCHSARDGVQALWFYWIDSVLAIKRYITKKQYAGKFYTAYETEFSKGGPRKRVFLSANSGLVVQAAQLIAKDSFPVLALFYADASFALQNMTHHPMYSKSWFPIIHIIRIILIILLMFLCSMSSQFARRRALESWSLDPCWMDSDIWWEKRQQTFQRLSLCECA